MAKYNVSCPICGESRNIQLFGKNKEREWKLEKFDWTCDECKSKAFKAKCETENKKASEEAKSMELPALEGSEKQIAWANTIRSKKLNELQTMNVRSEKETEKIEFESYLISKTSAKWWIDNRDNGLRELVISYLEVKKNTPNKEEKTAEIEAKIESTVKPENVKTNTVVEIGEGIFENHKTAKVIFPEKREDFREIIKSLGFVWSSTQNCWSRIPRGKIAEFMAEVGNKLLLAGFPIRIFDEQIRKNAVDGNFKKETSKWIHWIVDKAVFSISWNRNEGDFFDRAKRIKGARWDSTHHNMKVPSTSFAEIEDFAQTENFELSEGARKAIEETREVQKNILIVKPVKKEIVVEKNEEKIGEIDETLRDDN